MSFINKQAKKIMKKQLLPYMIEMYILGAEDYKAGTFSEERIKVTVEKIIDERFN